MPILSSSPSARLSIIYITVGALIEAWSLIWYRWLTRHPPDNEAVMYLCYGLILTGIIVFAIGVSLGWIGRAARKAELPPSEVNGAAAQAEVNMAGRAPIAVPNPAAAAYAPAMGAGGTVAPGVVPGTAAPAIPPAVVAPGGVAPGAQSGYQMRTT